MKVVSFMRDLVAKGMSWEDAASFAERFEEGIAEALETVRPAKTKNAERQARWRVRHKEQTENNVTNNVTRNATDNVSEPLPLSPSSPTPPSSTNPNQLPPIVPQKAVMVRAEKPASVDGLTEKLWAMGNQASRTRSGRADLRKAVSLAVRAGATADALEASVKAHCREAGDHAKGLHRLVNGEHWRDYGPKPPPSAAPIPPEIEEQRIRHLRDTGEWREAWGERPKAA